MKIYPQQNDTMATLWYELEETEQEVLTGAKYPTLAGKPAFQYPSKSKIIYLSEEEAKELNLTKADLYGL